MFKVSPNVLCRASETRDGRCGLIDDRECDRNHSLSISNRDDVRAVHTEFFWYAHRLQQPYMAPQQLPPFDTEVLHPPILTNCTKAERWYTAGSRFSIKPFSILLSPLVPRLVLSLVSSSSIGDPNSASDGQGILVSKRIPQAEEACLQRSLLQLTFLLLWIWLVLAGARSSIIPIPQDSPRKSTQTLGSLNSTPSSIQSGSLVVPVLFSLSTEG